MRIDTPKSMYLVAALALALAACGDSSEPDPLVTVTVPDPPPPATVEVPTPTSAPAEVIEEAPPVAEPEPPIATTKPEEALSTEPESAQPAPEPEGPIGYRVVGVAADDVLNVRAEPSASAEIVGTLAPDAVGVVVFDTWEDPWWRVSLDDGTTGFAHSAYLEMDERWTVGFDELPCAPEEAVWGESQRSSAPNAGSNAEFIYGYDHLSSAECERVVIQLGARVTRPPDFPSIAADRVPAGVEVRSEGNHIVVALPATLGANWHATTARFGDSLLLVTYGPAGWAELELHLISGSEREAHARFLDDPARIVVDLRLAAEQSGIDLSPVALGAVILTEPARWDGRDPATHQPLTITGYGTAYESQMLIDLSRADGGAVEASWVGGFDCTDNFGAATARGSTYCTFTSGDSIWGDFAVTVSDLDPGTYLFSMGGECMVDEVGEEACRVPTYEFTVHEAGATAAAALAPFFAAVAEWDAAMAHAARAFNAEFDADAGTVSTFASDTIAALSGPPIATLVPSGMSPELERAVLAVYADIDSRRAALTGAVSRLEYDVADALRCLANGSHSKARFAGDLALARDLAAREPAPSAAPDSVAAGVLAVRIDTIGLWNSGCDGCGGAEYDQTLPVDWENGLIEDRVGFAAEFDGVRWQVMINAC